MKIVRCVFFCLAWLAITALKAAAPDDSLSSAIPAADHPNVEVAPATAETIAAVRLTLSKPDTWSDMKSTLRSLDASAANLPQDQQYTVRCFRKSLALFEDYFAGHPFKLTDEERKSLMGAIQAYEDRFYSELKKVQQNRRSHPTEPQGCLGATDKARFAADFELDRFGPVFSPHNWKLNSPNDLAAAFIAVMRAYGDLLCTESFAANQPPLATVVPSENCSITNATASAVLDGGSYLLTLSFSSQAEVLRLLIANPDRRKHRDEIVHILNVLDRTTEALRSDNPAGKRLHNQLTSAITGLGVSPETKSICTMLDRVLTDKNLPWSEVYFAEKWN